MPKGRMLNRIKKVIPLHLRIAVFERDKNTCQYCGKIGQFVDSRYGRPTIVENPKKIDLRQNGNDNSLIPFEIDHIVPLIKRGQTILDNLLLSCRKCNRSKGYK